MLNGGNPNLIKAYAKHGPEVGLFNNLLTIRSIKLYADGALGSRGALLLEDYNDAPGQKGLRIQKLDY
jgi:predicted amidohydrolase YtcJ